MLAERKKKEFKKKLKKLAAKVCLIMLGCGCGYLLDILNDSDSAKAAISVRSNSPEGSREWMFSFSK